MEQTVTGVIKAVAGNGKNFLVEEDWYGVFNPSDLQAAKGDEVTFTYKQNGKWKNVKGKVVGGGSTAPSTGGSSVAPPRTGGRTFPVGALAPERTINRQNALTNAVNAYGHGTAFDNQDVTGLGDAIIELAEQFEAYTCGDNLLAEAAAELADENNAH